MNSDVDVNHNYLYSLEKAADANTNNKPGESTKQL